MSVFKIVICYFSYKAKDFDKSFKRGKICIINITKTFTCGENFDKNFFFSGSVLDRIRLLSRSATTLISNHENIKQQPH